MLGSEQNQPRNGDRLEQLQMTPMIDGVFQMLIFFMVGMQINEPQGLLQAHLPKDNRPERISPTPILRLRHFLHSEFALQRMRHSGTSTLFFEQYQFNGLAALKDKLIRIGKEALSMSVVIDGGSEVPFHYILGTVNACVKVKFTKI